MNDLLLATGILLASATTIVNTMPTSPHCPPGCDCMVATNSTAPCVTDITVCTGVTPHDEFNEELGKMVQVCNPANFVEPDRPIDCEKSSSTSIEDPSGEYSEVYDHYTNCNKPNQHCYRLTTCKVSTVDNVSACETETQYGDWKEAKKPTQANCDTP